MRLKHTLLTHAKRVTHSLKHRDFPVKALIRDVPYFSQRESRELNEAIHAGTIQPEDDPKWKKSGAKTKKEYAAWSQAGCGMACTKMLLAHKTGIIMPLVTLGKKCTAYGGYTMPLEESQGLLYGPYIEFLKAEFNMNARVISPLLPREIMHELSRGNYVIASVSPDIRQPGSTPKQKGGHLVLMLGYDLQEREFYFHNPSGFSVATQEYAAVSFDRFKEFFSGRGIVVDGKENREQT